MIRNINQLLLLSIMGSSVIIPMDPPKQDTHLKKITTLKNICNVAFLKGNDLLIVSNKGAYTTDCNQIDKEPTNLFSRKLNGYYPSSCFPNNRKDLIVINDTIAMHIYNVQGQKMWETNDRCYLTSCAFTANDTFYTIRSGLLENRNGLKFKIRTINRDEYLEMYDGPITTHPKEEKIFCTEKIFDSQHILYTITINSESVTVDSCELPQPSFSTKTEHDKIYGASPYVYAQHHSPISELIALHFCSYTTTGYALYDPLNKKVIAEFSPCYRLAFHPKKPLLAILTSKGFKGLIQIYDITTKTTTTITETALPELHKMHINDRLMDFSENGENLAFVMNNECYLLSNLYQET